VVVVFDDVLIEAMLNKARLSHTSWRDKHRVAVSLNILNQLLCFGFAVTKVFRRNISRSDEWIVNHSVQICGKDNHFIFIMLKKL
jgi:hypothetical protein